MTPEKILELTGKFLNRKVLASFGHFNLEKTQPVGLQPELALRFKNVFLDMFERLNYNLDKLTS